MNIARWDGTQWGISEKDSMELSLLYMVPLTDCISVAGPAPFDTVQLNISTVLDGLGFRPIGGGFNNTVYAIDRDFQSLIYSGGSFTQIGTIVNKISY